MGATNHTSNYNLPQWIGTDKPTFLGDLNDAFLKIDTQMKANADSATTAESAAGSAESAATAASQSASQALQAAQTAGTNATQALSTANNAASTANSAQQIANAASAITTPLSSNGGWITTIANVNETYFSTDANVNVYGQIFDQRLYIMYNATLNLIMLRGLLGINKGTVSTGQFVRLCTLPDNFPSTIMLRTISTFCNSYSTDSNNNHYVYNRYAYFDGRDIYVGIDALATSNNLNTTYNIQAIFNTVGWY